MNHLFYLALVIRITYSNHLISNTFCDFQQTLSKKDCRNRSILRLRSFRLRSMHRSIGGTIVQYGVRRFSKNNTIRQQFHPLGFFFIRKFIASEI